QVKRFESGEAVYNFTEQIIDQATVIIRAPKGIIKFSTPPNTRPFDEGSKIAGKAKVLLEGQTIDFKAKIGDDSIVLIIIPKDGKLLIEDQIAQRAQVYWCKASDDDPQPNIKVTLANPVDGAKFNQVKRAEMDRLIKEYFE